ncbi:unnamed protein product [Linum trigynum]|uniref:Uncharacterized protein n=2 Tax=Linum trigynum TaxID=586398 RepID=A0AAV2G188_9ROSI
MHSSRNHQMNKLLLHLIVPLSFFSLIFQSTSTFCGKTQIPTPLVHSNSTLPLSRILHCSKSQKLYFRTTLGLFPISSIDSHTKTLTIQHPSSPSCPSTKHYTSPSLLSAGFPAPPQPNSILLFNCSNSSSRDYSSLIQRCSAQSKSKAACFSPERDEGFGRSCLIVSNLGKVEEMGFHPENLSCSHYQPIHRRSLRDHEVELGTRVSFDIPDHVPNPCEECEKKGDCGAGLKCLCHPQLCRDKVVAGAGIATTADRNVIFLLFSFVVMCNFLVGS